MEENLNKDIQKGRWISDLGNGFYKNPIIYADYSDPDIVRAGDDFFMIASSFNCIPGLPVLHSKDLVNWKIVNHIINEIPLKDYDKVQHGKGIWAPTIKYHNNKFWVYVCTPDEGLFMAQAEHPMDKWSPLTHVKKVTGWIDPCAFWDDDGQGYIIHAFANSRVGLSSILHLCKLSEDGIEITDNGKIVVDVNGKHHVMEGPRMFKRNDYYYICAPAGGIDHGYQVIMRSKNIYGPYEEKIAIKEGDNSINGPRQGGFVKLDSGEEWFVHFQGLGAYGRVVNLEPVTWKDDWMIIGQDIDGDGIGEPVEVFKKPNVGREYVIEIPQTSDDFKGDTLGLQWQWHANFKENWYSLVENKDAIRVYSIPLPDKSNILFHAPNLLLQKFPAPVFDAYTKITFSPQSNTDICGLVISGLKYTYISLSKKDNTFYLSISNGFEEEEERKEIILIEKQLNDFNEIYLKVSIKNGGNCIFSYSIDGLNYFIIGEEFKAEAGRWIGAKVGIFSVNTGGIKSNGFADFHCFIIE